MIFLGLAALIMSGIALAPKIASAYRGDPSVKGPNYTQERHDAMAKAFENNDYEAWKELMAGRGRASQVINEGNFARFAEAYRLGNTAEANAIRAELGLGTGSRGGGRGRVGCMGSNL